MAKFEVQARVIDLLGMQQIANCPTAISELFKNAYDAYARQVMLDVYPDDDEAILWDNGIGMTEDEVLHRWLVVGAAGKEELRSSIEPPEGMETRPIQGEKGIGRLAISTLGDTLLLISRSRNPPAGAEPFVALLINWNLVRNEKLLLSQVDIPTITFNELVELDTGIVEDMVDQLRGVVYATESAWSGKEEFRRQRVLDQLDSYQAPMDGLRRLARSWTGQGTVFCIGHLVDEFRRYVERPGRHDDWESHPNVELVQLLSNFRKSSQWTTSNGNGIEFNADVRLWDQESRELRSLFDDYEAIGPEDIREYDHHVDVEFDEHGRYRGVLEIYGKPADLTRHDMQTKRPASCGPFRLRLWYFHGREGESRMEKRAWSNIDQKLRRFGGLMIYRDDLRVLPYGNPEFDWLRFEERRSKSASRYFFSYRRMFGYVDITRKDNPNLIDKAGREGLIQNTAYRDFRQLLVDFFSDLALKYFKKGTSFESKKQELKERDEKLKAERRRVRQLRKELQQKAQEKIDYIDRSDPEQLELFLDESIWELDKIDQPGSPEIADAIVRFEDRMAQMEGVARLSVPRGLSLGRDQKLKQLIADHRTSFDTFSGACREIRKKFQERVRKRWPDAEAAVDRKRLLENHRNQAKARIGLANKELNDRVGNELSGIKERLEDLYQQQLDRVDEALIAATSASSIDEALNTEAENLAEILGTLDEASASGKAVLDEHRERLGDYLHGYFGAARDEVLAAQSDEIEDLREQVDRNLELVQLGLSVEIIDHDLNRLYRGIKTNLARLRTMVRKAPNASRLIEELRGSFEHLEQRYKLMSPLYRGSYRLKSRIDGVRILTYCRDFLDGPLHSVGVELEATEAFRTYAIEEVPAVVLPVFVNLVDNSIYWLRDRDEKRVILDRHGGVLTVCDTGPGIHPTLFDEIFQPFVSTKPGGRGLGLYIAYANLTRYHHEIWATDDTVYRKLPGACICIRFHEDVVLTES